MLLLLVPLLQAGDSRIATLPPLLSALLVRTPGGDATQERGSLARCSACAAERPAQDGCAKLSCRDRPAD